jgi:hypothetical protein
LSGRTSGTTTQTDTSSKLNPGKSQGRPNEKPGLAAHRQKRPTRLRSLKKAPVPDEPKLRSEPDGPSKRYFMPRIARLPSRRSRVLLPPQRGQAARLPPVVVVAAPSHQSRQRAESDRGSSFSPSRCLRMRRRTPGINNTASIQADHFNDQRRTHRPISAEDPPTYVSGGPTDLCQRRTHRPMSRAREAEGRGPNERSTTTIGLARYD